MKQLTPIYSGRLKTARLIDKNRELLIGVQTGDFTRVKYAVEAGADYRFIYPDGKWHKYKSLAPFRVYCHTAMHIAAGLGHLKIYKYLCSMYPEEVHKDFQDRTPEVYAVQKGVSLEKIKKMSALKGYYDEVDRYGNSPLHHAAKFGAPGVYEYLVKLRYDENKINRKAETPKLLHARRTKNTKVIAEVEANIAEFLAEDRRREAQRVANWHQERQEEAQQMSERLIEVCSRPGEEFIINSLIEKGANPNYRNVMKVTPIMAAARSGQYENVDLLKGFYVDTSEYDKYMLVNSKLYKAVNIADNAAEIRTLVEQEEANVNFIHKSGASVLQRACKSRHDANIESLLLLGANINNLNKSGLVFLLESSKDRDLREKVAEELVCIIHNMLFNLVRYSGDVDRDKKLNDAKILFGKLNQFCPKVFLKQNGLAMNLAALGMRAEVQILFSKAPVCAVSLSGRGEFLKKLESKGGEFLLIAKLTRDVADQYERDHPLEPPVHFYLEEVPVPASPSTWTQRACEPSFLTGGRD